MRISHEDTWTVWLRAKGIITPLKNVDYSFKFIDTRRYNSVTTRGIIECIVKYVKREG